MTQITAYATTSPEGPFGPTKIERRELGPRDVSIAIAFAGICHSDIHAARGEWGRLPTYPFVPGHEIAGTVEAVGPEVTTHAVGDRVGVGCMVGSCRTCDQCLTGQEQNCRVGMISTYGGRDRDGTTTQGGYATHVVVDEHFVLQIPEGVPLDVAAPLLCAGITTYSPLRNWDVGTGSRVAVVGLGGLGHMGVRLAKAMGAQVTVLSHSANKEDDARSLGADDFRVTSDPAAFAPLRSSFDLVLNTVSAPFAPDLYLSTLDFGGSMVLVGLPSVPLSVRAFSLLGGRSFAGSSIGGIPQTQEMLDFCAQQGLGAQIEVIGPDDIDAAYERVVASDVRYRFVIDIAGMAD